MWQENMIEKKLFEQLDVAMPKLRRQSLIIGDDNLGYEGEIAGFEKALEFTLMHDNNQSRFHFSFNLFLIMFLRSH